MAIYNLGTAHGKIEIDTNDLKNADIALRGAGRSMVGFGAVALGAFGFVVGAAASFEKEMSFVKAVTASTDEEMKALSKSAIELGKKGPFGPREVAKGFVDLAKAGLTAEEIIGGVGEAAVNLAAAGDISFAESSEVLVNVLRSFNLTAADSTAVIDSIAGAANASTIDITDMAVSLKYAAAPAASLGVSLQDLNGALAILGNRGIRGSTGGTALRRIFINLAAPTKAAAKEMEALGIIAKDGTNILFDSAGKLKRLPEIFQILQDKTKGLTAQQKVASLNAIFGARAVNSALILMEGGAADFEKTLAKIGEATAADVAAERMDNLAGAIKRFKAAIEATFIETGSPFQKFLTNLVNVAREIVLWFGKIPKPISTFLLASLAVIGVLSLMAGVFLLTIGNIVRAARVFGELVHVARVLGPSLKVLAVSMAQVNVAFVTSPVFLLVAALVALAVAFYFLYTRVEGFREFIDKAWQEIQKIWDDVLDFAKKIPAYLKAAWEEVKRTTDRVWDAIYEKIKSVLVGVASTLSSALEQVVGFAKGLADAIGGAVLRAFDAFASFLRRLPGLLAGALGAAARAFVDFVTHLPEIIGTAIGLWIGSFIRLRITMAKISVQIVRIIFSALSKLPGIIGRMFKGRLLPIIKEWGGAVLRYIFTTLGQLLGAFGTFLQQLPGLFITALTSILTTVFSWGVQIVQFLLSTLFEVVRIFLSALAQLPGIMFNALAATIRFVVSFIPKAIAAAWAVGKAFVSGFWSIISGIPGLVWKIFTDVINIAKRLAGVVFGAAKGFATGLWNGFKKGLGISSPSFIEEAMFAIQGTTNDTLHQLKDQVRIMQGLNIGIPAIAGVAPSAATPGQSSVYNYTGPLIGQATIRNEEDITRLARELRGLTTTSNRGRGS